MNYAQAIKTRNERTSAQQTDVHIKKNVIQATSSNHNGQVKPTTDDIRTTEDQGQMEADVRGARRRRESEDENSDNVCSRDKRVKIKMTELAINPNVVAEAVCISPKSGNLFTANVIIKKNQHDYTIDSLDLTSETNPEIRSEARKMYYEFGGKVKQRSKNKEMRKDHRRQIGKSVLLTDLGVDHDNTETRIKNLAIQNSIHQELMNDRGHTLNHERQQIGKEHGRVTIKNGSLYQRIRQSLQIIQIQNY